MQLHETIYTRQHFRRQGRIIATEINKDLLTEVYGVIPIALGAVVNCYNSLFNSIQADEYREREEYQEIQGKKKRDGREDKRDSEGENRETKREERDKR